MTILKIFISTIIAINCLSVKAMEPLEPWERVNMTEEEFVLISSVVEAESNRDPENIEGRTMIAVCILNRVRDSRFPNTITGVLTAPGQFSTVRGGHSVTNRTDLSDRAVIEAVQWIHSGEEYPWVLYFNCRGYNGGTPYAQIGGLIDADALSAFVGDLRNTLHKEQSTFKAMTEIEFNTRDYMLLNFQQTIDNAPTVDTTCPNCDSGYAQGYSDGYLKGKEDRPQGEWIPTVIDTGLFERSVCREWQCSNCGEVVKMKYPFCHCGAVMRVKDELNNELNNELNELNHEKEHKERIFNPFDHRTIGEI